MEEKLDKFLAYLEENGVEISGDNLDWEKEADMDAALDFADSF